MPDACGVGQLLTLEDAVMKDTVGTLLREAWKAQGPTACLHQDLSQERSFSGVITGAYICTKCGSLFAVTQKDKHPMTSSTP